MKNTVLITGCSTGFGKLAVKTFQEANWNVVATMRSPEMETELNKLANVWVTRLDVTDKESIDAVVSGAIEKFGKIDVLVNNAGYGSHAYLEQFPEQKIYDLFETNVFGLIRVSQAVLPHMRKNRKGVIINVTSMAGHVGFALTSTYCASKHAVEGLTEGMAMEYKPFGIRVNAVAPGAFGTSFGANSDMNIQYGDIEIQQHAGEIAQNFVKVAEEMMNQGDQKADPQEVVDVIYKCATEEMPIHNIVGSDAEILIQMKTTLPQDEFHQKMSEFIMPQS